MSSCSSCGGLRYTSPEQIYRNLLDLASDFLSSSEEGKETGEENKIAIALLKVKRCDLKAKVYFLVEREKVGLRKKVDENFFQQAAKLLDVISRSDLAVKMEVEEISTEAAGCGEMKGTIRRIEKIMIQALKYAKDAMTLNIEQTIAQEETCIQEKEKAISEYQEPNQLGLIDLNEAIKEARQIRKDLRHRLQVLAKLEPEKILFTPPSFEEMGEICVSQSSES